MGDADAMAAAICRLLGDPEAAQRMGKLGRQRVRDYFTIEHTASKVEKLYMEILSRRGNRRRFRSGFSRTAARFALCMAIVLIAFTVSTVLRNAFQQYAPLGAPYLIAAITASVLFGASAGWTVIALSIAAISWELPPADSFLVSRPELPRLISFTVLSIVVTQLIGLLRGANHRLEAEQKASELARKRLDFFVRITNALAIPTNMAAQSTRSDTWPPRCSRIGW